MMTTLSLAVVLGTAFGLGICLAVSPVPRWGAPSLSRRIGPYLRDIADPRGIVVADRPRSVDILALGRRLQQSLGARIGASVAVTRRLDQAAWQMDAATFRGRQLLWALAGLAAGGIIAVVLVVAGVATSGTAVLPVLCAVAAAAGYEFFLTQAARRRVARIEEELPTVLDFLSLCLAAGEGLLDTLRRVSNAGGGELTTEIRTVVLAVGTGSSLSDALIALTRRVHVPAATRAIDQLVAAIERGAPLAAVLQAQAHDAREEAKRSLIERAGRNELTMMFPLVFLILPLSVIFAIFPGVLMLRLGLG